MLGGRDERLFEYDWLESRMDKRSTMGWAGEWRL
jgi:hypothetical protein